MTGYSFQMVNYQREKPPEDKGILFKRPFTEFGMTFSEDARYFIPGDELETAINTAIAVGCPLLITGEAGTGKTQAAYYAAHNLGVEPVIHFQVKSDCAAKDLLYHFDAVRYFHDAHIRKNGERLEKSDYVEKRALWDAMTSEFPKILLIDEIDKAPRDFPNDLLHELDQMTFKITETGETVSASKKMRPMVFITSNSERRLPEPFLRRCVYHHIEFDDRILEKAVEKRRHVYAGLSSEFIQTAMQRFLALRDRTLRKRPATGEFLVWLRVLALAVGTYPERLDQDLSRLPYIGALLKDHQDIGELKRSGRR